MSNIRISRPAAQNPTGLTPVAGYNKPATNTIGDFARKQGITFTGQQDALGKLEQSLAKNKELAEKFKGTRYEKVYRAQVEKLEKQLAQQKAVAPAQTAKPFNQSLNERITAQMGQNPQYGGKTVKSGNQYVAQSAQDTRELAELNKALDARDAAQAAQKAQQTEQAWQQYANAPKGQQTYDGVFKFRQAEKEAQEAAARGIAPQAGNPAVASTTYKPQGAGTQIKEAVADKLKQKPVVTAETINAGLGIGNAPKSAQESAGVFIKRGVEQALSKPATTSAGAIDAALGIGQGAKSAEESAKIFAANGSNPVARPFNQALNERITAQMGNKPQYGGKTIKVGDKYIAQSAEETQRLAELGKKGILGKTGAWLKNKGTAAGGFLKKHGGKLAAAAAILGLGAFLISKCTGNDDKAQVASVPPTQDTTPKKPETPANPTPAVPANPQEPEKPENPTKPQDPKKPENPAPAVPVNPQDSKKPENPANPAPADQPADDADNNVIQESPIHKDEAPESNYILKAKYCGMSQYVAAAYGVDEGSAKHKQIMEKLWETNPGLRNKTLYLGDKVFLPEVVIDGEKVVPNLDKQPADLPKPDKAQELERYEGYKGQERYGVGETHDDEANQYHDTDKKKVQDKANEEA